MNALSFDVGARVVLFNLISKPQLNGRLGRVVRDFNRHTRRVGVLLEARSRDTAPIALKLTNIMRIHEW